MTELSLDRYNSLPTNKKVAAYARVSVANEQLLHSLSSQVSYYSDLIQKTPGWEYAGVYVDAGITGAKAKVRPEFQRMIADCEAGKIDIILTKSISRFARNTVDLLSTVRHLKELGVEVRFEKEHINSLSGDGEVMLSILASFAEQESISLSENIKWRFQKKFKKGELASHQKMLGYRWEGDKRVIVPEEAEIVRFVFDEYLAGKSFVAIARELDEKGIKSSREAKKYPWASIRLMLRTEEYTGTIVMQKVYNISPRKTRLNRGEVAMYKIDEHHEAIIDRETFDKVQMIMEKRAAENADRRMLDSPFKGLIRCGKCGRVVYGHRTSTSLQKGDSRLITWKCNGKNNGGRCDCENWHEGELYAAVEEKFGTGSVEEELSRVKSIRMYDDKLEFELKNGRRKTAARTAQPTATRPPRTTATSTRPPRTTQPTQPHPPQPIHQPHQYNQLNDHRPPHSTV